MNYNLIVIGGGPAGIMSAGRAAENGACVLLLEKNDKLGVKLLITGKGRCNITNAEEDQFPKVKNPLNEVKNIVKQLQDAGFITQ